MSSGGSQQPVVTTQSSTPWAGAQPHLNRVMGQAEYLYGTAGGYQPYLGATQAPKNPALAMGLANASGMAQGNMGGTPGVLAAQGLAQNQVQNQGLTPGHQGALGMLGNIQTGMSNLYNDPTTANQYGALYNEASGQQNPYLLQTIAANDQRIADRVNASMSGSGRYGSGAHTDVLARSLAEAANPILAQDYERRQQQRMGATQGLQGVMGQRLANAQAQAALQGGISDIYSGGLNRAGQFSQTIPGLDAAQYAPSERLMGLGQYETDRSQQDLNADIQRFNLLQSYPWEQLARYSGIVGGMGGLGGSRVTSAPNLNAPIGGLQGALGGALAGGSIGSAFGPIGAGIGALGGGLFGGLR